MVWNLPQLTKTTTHTNTIVQSNTPDPGGIIVVSPVTCLVLTKNRTGTVQFWNQLWWSETYKVKLHYNKNVKITSFLSSHLFNVYLSKYWWLRACCFNKTFSKEILFMHIQVTNTKTICRFCKIGQKWWRAGTVITENKCMLDMDSSLADFSDSYCTSS